MHSTFFAGTSTCTSCYCRCCTLVRFAHCEFDVVACRLGVEHGGTGTLFANNQLCPFPGLMLSHSPYVSTGWPLPIQLLFKLILMLRSKSMGAWRSQRQWWSWACIPKPLFRVWKGAEHLCSSFQALFAGGSRNKTCPLGNTIPTWHLVTAQWKSVSKEKWRTGG